MTRLLAIIALSIAALLGTPQPGAAQMDARDMEICRQSCMARARDASDPRYKSCVRSRCMGQSVRRSTGSPQRRSTAARETPAAPVAAAMGLWALNSHPALGTAVLTQTEQGVVGLACAPEGAALRVTNGLFRTPTLGWITDTGSSGGSIALSAGAAYSEQTGDACTLGLGGLAAAGTLVLVDTEVRPLGSGRGYAVTVPGGEVTVLSGAELQARVPGARTVALQGMATGLGALAASCPALAQAMRSPCP